jgi:hypothetical protein
LIISQVKNKWDIIKLTRDLHSTENYKEQITQKAIKLYAGIVIAQKEITASAPIKGV